MNSPIPRAGVLLVSALLLLFAFADTRLRAATVPWDGGGDGVTFSDAANWAGDVLPGAADHAVITMPGTYTVRLSVNTALGGLTLGGPSGAQTLDASGFTLSLGTDSSVVDTNGVLAIGGMVDVRNTVLGIDGPLSVRGRVDWGNGVIYANTYYQPANGRVVTIEPGGMMRWIGPGARTISATLDNRGTLRWEEGLTLYSQGYTVSSSGLFDIVLASDATFGRTGVNSQGPWIFTNTGTVRKTGPGSATIGVELRTIGGTVEVREDTLRQNFTSRWERTFLRVDSGSVLMLSSNGEHEPHTVADTLRGTIDGAFVLRAVAYGYYATMVADRVVGGIVDIEGSGLQVHGANLGGVYDPPTATYAPAPVNIGLVRFVGGEDNSIAGPFINRGVLRWESARLLYNVNASFANDSLFEIRLDTAGNFITNGVNGGRPGPLMNSGTILKTGRGRAYSNVDLLVRRGLVDVREGMVAQDARTRWEDAVVAVSPGATLQLGGYLLPHVIAGTLRGTALGTFLVSGLQYGYYTNLVADTVRGGRLEIGGTGVQASEIEIGTPSGQPAPVNGGLFRFVGDAYQYVRADLRNEGTMRWERGTIYAWNGITIANAGLFEIESGRSLNGATAGGIAVYSNEASGITRKLDTTRTTMVASIVNDGRFAVLGGQLAVENVFTNTVRFNAGGTLAGVGTFDVGAIIDTVRLANDGITSPGPGDAGEGVGTLTVRGPLPYDRMAFELAGTDSALYDRLIVAGATARLDSVVALVSLSGGFVPVSGNFFDVVTASVTDRLLDVVEVGTAVRFFDIYPGTGVRLVLDTAAAGEPTVRVIAPAVGARQGESFDLPITIIATAGARAAGATEVTFTLRFNATLLAPSGTAPRGSLDAGERLVSLRVPIGASDTTVYLLRVTAALGNDSTTALGVEAAATNAAGVAVTGRDGLFRLLDLCREGGARLLNPDGVVAMSRVRPNPVSDDIAFELDIIETGVTTIALVDLRGTAVRTFVQWPLPRGHNLIRLDARDVPAGLYFLTVGTPTVRLTQIIEVVR